MTGLSLAGLVVMMALLALAAPPLFFAKTLRRLWREPMLARPVLVIETDDWGAGPVSQAPALQSLAQVASRHRDSSGRPPTLSIAVVLAIPDGRTMRRASGYHRLTLDHPSQAAVFRSLLAGRDAGVFALHLHGHEHYWPKAILRSNDPVVVAWRLQSEPQVTEMLPPHLQSRWVDAHSLPSTPLAPTDVRAFVRDEVGEFKRLFGESPLVVVPPTFVWTTTVEDAWAAEGVRCVVTPGWRSTLRGADGLPGGDEGPITNGDRRGDLTYVVRNGYFEPERGRGAASALQSLSEAVALARPCVLENHRSNFIGDASVCERVHAELDQLLRESLVRHPGLRFLSTMELACILRDRDPAWVVEGLRPRLVIWLERLRRAGRPWKVMTVTGAAAVLCTTIRLLAPTQQRRHMGAA